MLIVITVLRPNLDLVATNPFKHTWPAVAVAKHTKGIRKVPPKEDNITKERRDRVDRGREWPILHQEP